MFRKLIDFIDGFLNRITMYRAVLYYLILLLAAAVIFSFFGLLHYSPAGIVSSLIIILIVSWITNKIFASVFKVPANAESLYITALILALIITPMQTLLDLSALPTLLWASILAMASKYILAINRKHLFNPAALAVALTALVLNQPASWWIGNSLMMPLVLVGGLLLVRKIIRFDLVLSFLGVSLAVILATGSGTSGIFSTLNQALFHSPWLFFAFVMLTEPLTTPPTKSLRVAYGALTGFLFAPAIHLGSVYSTPELALLSANVFSYLVSPKRKYLLRLKEKKMIADDVYDFVFEPDQKLKFKPGQYLEWTLGNVSLDSRGNRRYFTVASAPEESDVRLGVKFYPHPSSFKKKLLDLKPGEEITAGSCAGDFVLPKDKNKKIVFLAGGIGITPFRSMIGQLLDRNEKRPIILLYSNKTIEEIAYADILMKAEEKLDLRTIYTLTEPNQIPAGWPGLRSRLTAQTIIKTVPDYRERMFYVSGPRSFVAAMEETLREMDLRQNQIKVDFFPGFA